MKSTLILPKSITSFMSVFKKNGFEIYLVGGAVRDLLIAKNPPAPTGSGPAGEKNWDFTTNANPKEIQQLFPKNFYNNNYGTVSIPINGIIFEVTPFRKESNYNDFRHPEKIAWAKTIEEDLARRDFTINTIAYDGSTLTDPYYGLSDIRNRLIRAVGNADKRFSEDALRLLRAVRLATELEFLIDDTTRQAIIDNSQLITHVSGERVRDELFKILASPNPAEGILFLKNTRLLYFLLPELDRCFDLPQKSPGRHHIYDVGTHLVLSLKNCPSLNLITRFASLIHDIGKVDTFAKDKKTGALTFYNHEIVGARLTEKIALRFRLSKEEREKLVTLVRFHMFTVSELQTDKAVRRFIRQVGKENIQNMLDLRTADRVGSGARKTSWRTELFKKRLIEVQKQPFTVADLAINGNDVMSELNIKPGPRIGKILMIIFNDVVNKKIKNNRKNLLEELKKIR